MSTSTRSLETLEPWASVRNKDVRLRGQDLALQSTLIPNYINEKLRGATKCSMPMLLGSVDDDEVEAFSADVPIAESETQAPQVS